MIYPIDIHTHHISAVPGQAIESCLPDTFQPQPRSWYSIGLHPWYLDRYIWTNIAFQQKFEAILHHPQVVAIGETGLDKLISLPIEHQTKAFCYQAKLAESIGKPLVIHAVKAVDEILALQKELKPSVPWIIHGFRGKVPQADAYLRHGFYLSFGEKYNDKALNYIPTSNLFLETDESHHNINVLYEQAAYIRGTTARTLKETIAQNIRKIFFSH